MRTLLLLSLLFFTTAQRSFCQYFSVTTENKYINQLFAADDSTFKKIVDHVDLTGTIKELRNRNFVLNVTKSVNGIMELPDSLKRYTLQNKAFRVVLRGYLAEFFHQDLTEKTNKNDSLIQGFTSKEKQVLYSLKQLTFDEYLYESSSSESVIVFGADGKPRLEYFEVAKKNFEVSTESDYQMIQLKLTYSPEYADIYFIPKSEWVYKFKLTNPPVAKQVAKMMGKFGLYRVKQVKNPLKIDLQERAYVIVYDQQGRLSFDIAMPSTQNTDNNTMSVKLHE